MQERCRISISSIPVCLRQSFLVSARSSSFQSTSAPTIAIARCDLVGWVGGKKIARPGFSQVPTAGLVVRTPNSGNSIIYCMLWCTYCTREKYQRVFLQERAGGPFARKEAVGGEMGGHQPLYSEGVGLGLPFWEHFGFRVGESRLRFRVLCLRSWA